MGKVLKLFSQGGRRALFGLMALTILASQLAFMAPVHAIDAMLSGQVTSGAFGQAFEGAVVDLLDASSVVVASDATDQTGAYSMIVASGTYTVRVTPPTDSGFQVATLANYVLSTNQVLNFALVPVDETPPLHTYSGTIKDQDGVPQQGARVFIDNATSTTDAAGAFSMQLTEGEHAFNAEVPQWGNLIGRGILFNLTADLHQDHIIQTAKINVRVLDTNEAPIQGIRVIGNQYATSAFPESFQFQPSYKVGLQAPQASVVTNAQGIATLTMPLLSNFQRIGLQMIDDSGQYVSFGMDYTDPLTDGMIITTHMQLAPQNHTYSGIFRDQHNTPIAGATIYISDKESVTDANGAFSLELPEGEYGPNARVYGRNIIGLGGAVINLNQDISQDLTLYTNKLTVHVTDPEGNSLPGVRLHAAQYGPSNSQPRGNQLLPGYPTLIQNEQVTATTGANGRYEMTLLQLSNFGRLDLSAEDLSGQFQSNGQSFTTAPADGSEVTIQLPRVPERHTFSGTLKDQHGTPLPDFQLQMDGGSTVTDANGAFSMEIFEGEQVINARAPASSPIGDRLISGLAPAFTLTGDMYQDLVLNLPKVNVRVVDPNGNTLSGIRVTMTETAANNSAFGESMQFLPGQLARISTLPIVKTMTTGASGVVTANFFTLTNFGQFRVVVEDLNGLYQTFQVTSTTAITDDMTIVAQMQLPSPPGVPQNLQAASPTNQTVHLSWNAVSTATSYKLFRDGQEMAEVASTSVNDVPDADGTYVYTVKACNQNGCGNSSASRTVVYDTTRPTLGSSSWFGNPLTEGGEATVTVGVTDTLSGVVAGEYFIGSDPGQGNGIAMNLNAGELNAVLGEGLEPGIYTVHMRAKDAAGNWSSAVDAEELEVNPSDTTAPQITHNLSAPANAAGWHNTPVTLTWVVEDLESAVTNQEGCGESIVNTNGTHTLMCSATSSGGTANESVIIKYDASAPSIGTPAWSANPVDEGNNTTLTVPVADNLSGVVAAEYYIGATDPGQGNAPAMSLGTNEATATFGNDLEPGTYAVHVRAQDEAGNWSTVLERSLSVANDSTTVVSGHVTSLYDNSSLAGVSIQVFERNTTNVIGTTVTDSSGAYSVSTPAVAAEIVATPPAGSGYGYNALLVDLRYADVTQDIQLAMSEITGLTGPSPTNQPPTFSWDAHPLATYYEVQRVGAGGLGTTTDTSFTHTTAPAHNTHTYQVRPCNAVACGGWSPYLVIKYDNQGPTFGVPQVTPSNTFAEGDEVNLSVPVQDAMSDITRVEYYFDTDPGPGNGTAMDVPVGMSVTATAQLGSNLAAGNHWLYIRARDAAGNWSDTLSRLLVVQSVDSTPPSIVPQYSQMPGLGGWNNAPIVLTWTITDPESSITNQTGCDPVNVTTETVGTNVTCSATSAGGTTSESVTIKLDMTSPVLGAPAWASNPLAVGGTTSFTIAATDTLSGVTAGEYFVGTDPGVGNATALTWNGSSLASNSFGSNLAVGVYPVGVRARDVAGNWSTTETLYLVVFDPAAPTQILGQNRLAPVFGADVLPGLTNDPQQNDRADFGFDVRLLANGQVDSTSDFSFNYETGKKCNSPNPENCHVTSFTASGFSWLTVNGTNNATGTFQGTGSLTIDGVTTQNPFRVVGVDAQLLGTGSDDVNILVFAPGADPNTSAPIYHVHRSPTGQGVIIQ